MATAPSAEESARRILSIYMRHNCRAGHGLSTKNFMRSFMEPGWQQSDLKAGLDYAIDQTWIEARGSDNFILTDAGFAEA